MRGDVRITAYCSVSFQPSYAQFVLYDTQMEFDPNEEPLWARPEEAEGPVSARQSELSIGLFADAEVQVGLSVYPMPPEPLEGEWDVNVEVSLLVASGELGIRDVVQDVPEATIAVPSGWLRLRIMGRGVSDHQAFRIQVWSATGSVD